MAWMQTIQVEPVERATLAAICPAVMEELAGWLLGLDPGTVGRAHSAVPLQHAEPDGAVLAAIEARYAAHRLSPVFRLPLAASFELLHEALARRGYVPVQRTQVQTAPARAMVQRFSRSSVELATVPDEAWTAVFLGEGFDPVDGANRVRMLSRAKGAVFASVQVNGRVVAAGVGCFSHGWASVHGMRTALGHRGQGLAGGILSALAGEAQARKIEQVFLQVGAGNANAQSLYRQAGFTTAWTYDYWRKPMPHHAA